VSTTASVSQPPQQAPHQGQQLAAHWADYLRTRAGLRDSRALIRQHRAFLKEAGPRLAAYLAQHQAFLAGTGRDGAFDPWLRSLKIPPSTAYSLIERFANPNKPKKLKSPWDCPNFARDVPRPGPVSLVFKGHRLAMKLSVRQTVLLRDILKDTTRPQAPPFDYADDLLNVLNWRLRNSPPAQPRSTANQPSTIRIRLGEHGYDYTQLSDPH